MLILTILPKLRIFLLADIPAINQSSSQPVQRPSINMHYSAIVITAMSSMTAVHALGINCRGQKSPIFLHPLQYPRLSVSIGSSNCLSQGNVLTTIYNQILNLNQATPYVDGQHIACSKNTCAFYQNLPVGTYTAGQAATHVKNLLNHGW